MPEGRFKYEKLIKYPHLKPEDIFTWEAFIDKNPNEYISIDYDYPLGQMPEHIAQAKQLDIAGAEKTFQYKADVIAYSADHIDIIELKGKAVPGTIGQVKSYKNIYDRDVKPKLRTQAVIIATSISFDLERLAKEDSVKLIIV